MTTTPFDALMDQLQLLGGLFGEYGTMLAEKKQALLDNDYEELEAVVAEEEEMLVQIGEAESVRDRISRELCRQMGLAQDAPVSQIASKLEEKAGVDLMVHVAKLAQQLREVSLMHLQIGEMLQFHLRQMDFLREASMSDQPKPTYNPLQPQKGKPNPGWFKGNG